MKRYGLMLVCLLVSVFAFGQTAQNAVWLIGDGMGIGTMGLLIQGVQKTNLPAYPDKQSALEKFINASKTGLFFTDTHDTLVTDSACAATQMACGERSTPGTIGMDAQWKSVRTLLEEAVEEGKSVGVITDSYVVDATPAGFLAHVQNRGQKYEIARQFIDSQAQVVLGGGRKYFTERENKKLFKQARKKGWQIVENAQDMAKVKKGRILGLFADESLPFYGEKDKYPQVPTLKEMTQKAIELLSQNEKGFVLMVEAGKIDWAAHNNEAGPTLWEMLNLDETLAYVWDFAKKDGKTLVYLNSDHDTGTPVFHYRSLDADKVKLKNEAGERLYNGRMDYVNFQYYQKMLKHKEMLYFSYGNFKALPAKEQTAEKLQEICNKVLGEEMDLNLNGEIPDYATLMKKVNDAYGMVWATTNHSGAVLLGVAYGPGSGLFEGVYHNSDLKEKFEKALDL